MDLDLSSNVMQLKKPLLLFFDLRFVEVVGGRKAEFKINNKSSFKFKFNSLFKHGKNSITSEQ